MRIAGALLVAASLAVVSLSAQSPAPLPGATYGADPNYKVARTRDGHPDLQGVWSNNSVTPMTRPRQWKDKTTITDAELTELKMLVAKSADDGGDAIFQNLVQLALDTKETGKFDQTSYDADHRQLQPVLDGRARMGSSDLAHHRSSGRPVPSAHTRSRNPPQRQAPAGTASVG